MNVGILKIGMKLTTDMNSAAALEVFSIIKLLRQANIDVTILTTEFTEENKIPDTTYINMFHVEDVNALGLDKLIVFNGLHNNSTGNELNYKFINLFHGRVYFCLTDLLYMPINKITRKDMVCLCHTYNPAYIIDKTQFSDKYAIFEHILFYPFSCLPLLDAKYCNARDTNDFDILYGGSLRDGTRLEKLQHYLYDLPTNFSVGMFGTIINIASDQVLEHKPILMPKETTLAGYSKRMQTSLSTLVVNEQYHAAAHMFSQRVYQGIVDGNIVFIDKSTEPTCAIFGEKAALTNWLYVNNKTELIEKLNKLKRMSKNKIQDILTEQIELTKKIKPLVADFVGVLDG